MKVLFFISVYDNSLGGHFQSLNHISCKLAESIDVKIISIGPGHNRVIASNPFFYKHLFFNGLNFLTLKKEIDALTQHIRPNIYHFFDRGSYNVLRLFLSTQVRKLFINKCGGPNRKTYPAIYNIILFSHENLSWFKKKKKFNESSIYLIPNRVLPALSKISAPKVNNNPGLFTFLRICRIGSTHKKSILDSIYLLQRLSDFVNKEIELIIIGYVEDANLECFIKSHPLYKSGNIKLYTSNKYTVNASSYIHIADAVIGTGRGLMEAASLRKPVLTLNNNDNLPVLITKDNYYEAFKTNFSARNHFNDNSKNIDLIRKLIHDKDFYNQTAGFSLELFEKHFDLNKVPELYLDAYKNARYGKRRLWGDLEMILKACWRFFRFNNANTWRLNSQ